MPQTIDMHTEEHGRTVPLHVSVDSGIGLSTESVRIIDAISPTVDAERVEGGVEITVDDYRHAPQSVTLYDGAKGDRGDRGDTGATGPRGERGEKGEPGEPGYTPVKGVDYNDGVSPSISVTNITGGHRVSITDASGTKTFDVMDGEDGLPGEPGQPGQRGEKGDTGAAGDDGFSPIASVSKSGKIATITVTDKNGTTTAQVSDGEDGQSADMSLYRTSADQDVIDAGKLGNTDTAHRTAAIYYGHVDSTSTSTKFTATIPGITSYYDGLTILLKNGVVTSASGFTINVNGLGAKQAYSNMAAATAESTLFNVNYTMLFIYDSTRVSGGGWVMYRGYNSNDNTIGYQLRTNSSSRPATDKFYRYRLLFTSPDNTKWVPANTSTSTNATAVRTPNQRPINPFGEIVYYATTTAIDAGSSPAAAQLWEQYVLTLGYSFNGTGAALVLPYPSPIYLKCAPQTDGSAIIDETTPYVTALPGTADGKIYIYLGRIYSATNIELLPVHPVYEYKDGAVRLWTNAAASGGGASDLEDLSDVEFPSTPQDGNVLMYDKRAGKWIASNPQRNTVFLSEYDDGEGTTYTYLYDSLNYSTDIAPYLEQGIPISVNDPDSEANPLLHLIGWMHDGLDNYGSDKYEAWFIDMRYPLSLTIRRFVSSFESDFGERVFKLIT